MTTYKSALKSISNAKTIKRFKQLDNVFKICYEVGELTASEYGRLDIRLLNKVIAFEFNQGGE